MQEINLKKNKNLTTNIIFLLICLFILFILIEFSLRIFYPQPVIMSELSCTFFNFFNESSYLPWQLKDSYIGRHVSVRGEFNVSANTNSLGYRDYEFNISKPKSIYRILFLGDSFTYGLGVELDEVYVKQFEKLMNKERKKYEVINAGYKSGYSPDTEYLFLKKEGLSLNPDMVVVGLFVGNDFSDYRGLEHVWKLDEENDLIKIESRSTYIDDLGRLRFNSSRENKEPKYKEIIYKTNVFFSSHSHLYTLFKNSFRNILLTLYFGRPKPSVYSKDYTDEVIKDINATLDLLLRMKKISDKNDIDFVIVVIPRRASVYDYKIKDKEGALLNWTKPYHILTEFGKEKNITIINLLPYFKEEASDNENEFYFKIDSHFNKNGHYIAGQAVYKEFVIKNLIKK